MGPYDNRTGVHQRSKDWDDGQWLVGEDGMLYILPIGGDDVEGPDDQKAADILAQLRRSRTETLTEEEADALGLRIVSDVLKRFDPEIGYLSA